MPDLTTALRQHLDDQTPAAVAPFADVQRRARRRTRVRTTVGAVLAAASVAAVTTIVAVNVDRAPSGPVAGPVASLSGPTGGPATSPSTADGPPPQRITVGGSDLALAGETNIGQVWIDLVDRSTLVVQAGLDTAGVKAPLGDPYCVPYTVVRVLGQDANSIRIAAYNYKPAAPATGNVMCPGFGYPTKEHRLKLAAPVDGRTVLHGSTAVPVVDPATVLRPSYLPAGYSQPGVLTVDWPRPDGRAGYAELRYIRNPGDSFYVRQADPAAEQVINGTPGQAGLFGPETSFDVVAHPTIRGHDGVLFTYGPQLRCLRWREAADLAVVVCSSGGLEAHLSADELVRIAESLRRTR
jgi:hypothetical protein